MQIPIFRPKRLILKSGISKSQSTANPSFPPDMRNTVNTPVSIIAIITEDTLLFLKTPAIIPVIANPPTSIADVIVIRVECRIIFIISIMPADRHTIIDMAVFFLHCLVPSSFIFTLSILMTLLR